MKVGFYYNFKTMSSILSCIILDVNLDRKVLRDQVERILRVEQKLVICQCQTPALQHLLLPETHLFILCE